MSKLKELKKKQEGQIGRKSVYTDLSKTFVVRSHKNVEYAGRKIKLKESFFLGGEVWERGS